MIPRVFAALAALACVTLWGGAMRAQIDPPNPPTPYAPPSPNRATVVIAWPDAPPDAHADIEREPEPCRLKAGVCTRRVRVGQDSSRKVTLYGTGYPATPVSVGPATHWRVTVSPQPCPSLWLDPGGLPSGTDVLVQRVVADVAAGPVRSTSSVRVFRWPEDVHGGDPNEQQKSPASQNVRLTDRVADAMHLASADSCPLQPGAYDFIFEHADYHAAHSRISFPAQNVVNAPALKKKAGTIVITSAVGDVDVLVDGQRRAYIDNAGDNDPVTKIADIAPGTHTVELSMRPGHFDCHDLAATVLPSQVFLRCRSSDVHTPDWGQFPHSTEALVEDGKDAEVRFGLPPAPPAPANSRDSGPEPWAEAMCRRSGRCFALGLLQHRRGRDPSASFKRACRGERQMRVLNSVDAPSTFDSTRDDAETEVRNACTAYAWSAYAWRKTSGDKIGKYYLCGAPVASSADPVSPCVRERLSRQSQVLVNPTDYMKIGSLSIVSAVPLALTAGIGQEHQVYSVSYSVSLSNSSGLALDMQANFGAAEFLRWDAALTNRSWSMTFDAGYEVGVAWKPAAHIYAILHGQLGFTAAPLAGTYGGRAAIGYTTSALPMTRDEFFFELGSYLQGADRSLFYPSDRDIIGAAPDLATLRARAAAAAGAPVLMWTPALTIGYVFY